jgi:hypothetical protein
MGILDGNPKNEPMHYGEIHGVWHFCFNSKGVFSGYQVFKNHAGDDDLKDILDAAIKGAKMEIKELETLLTENGIAPPPISPDRPEAKLEDIPIGARFTDQEIAATVAHHTAIALVACSQIMGVSIREDVGALFAKYHTEKAALGLRILRLSKEKAWLIPPPLHMQSPELVKK